MRKLTTTVAVMMLTATPLLAQDTTVTDPLPAETDEVVTDEVMTDEVIVDDGMETDVMTDTTTDAVAAPTTFTPMLVEEGYMPADLTIYTADQLLGVDIRDTNNDGVGSVSDIGFAADGTMSHIVTDVGGFLGIGSRSVAIPVTDAVLYSDANGNLLIYVSLTRELIEELPEFTPPAE